VIGDRFEIQMRHTRRHAISRAGGLLDAARWRSSKAAPPLQLARRRVQAHRAIPREEEGIQSNQFLPPTTNPSAPSMRVAGAVRRGPAARFEVAKRPLEQAAAAAATASPAGASYAP
jgi:hypothetical protein